MRKHTPFTHTSIDTDTHTQSIIAIAQLRSSVKVEVAVLGSRA